MVETKTHKFFKILEDTFVGERIEGEGGYVNLLKVKSEYFNKRVKPELEKLIEERTREFPEFKEELLDKLYDFFHKYLNETGTPLMGLTPYYASVFDRIYGEGDVKLYWKTSRHYYIKSDRILRNMEIEVEDFKIFFDVSSLEYKKANEKRALIYKYQDYLKDQKKLILQVLYKEGNRETKIEEIRREIKKKLGLKRYTKEIPSEEVIKKAIADFEKQQKVDYFICKDAEKFLKEQFDLWMYQYVYGLIGHEDTTLWTEKRIKQLQILKEIAHRIIDWIALFENELLKIWLKPRFVFNSNYVITLDRIEEKEGGLEVIKKILSHPKIDKQIEEWKELKIVDEEFNKDEVLIEDLHGIKLNPKYKFLPVDTKYFKDLEIEILSLFENIDEELDGWLIKSENFQALNTILPKFKEKVQTIYIDPPFNKEQDADYYYLVDYKDSTWITMLENRIRLGRELLNERGSIFVRCDYNGNMYVRLLLNEIFGEENFRNEIDVKRTKTLKGETKKFHTANDTIFLYCKDLNTMFFKGYRKLKDKPEWVRMHLPGTVKDREKAYRIIFGKKVYPPKGRKWVLSQEAIDKAIEEGLIKWDEELNEPLFLSKYETVGSDWTDIPGYSQTWNFKTENSEILLKRVIESTSEEGDIILDFFLGSGTTTAVAHKLKRKWIGIEMGEHFYTVVLPRMKKVLAYDKSGISKEKDVKEKYNKNNAGGFFKYFELEQYEEILRTIRYKDVEKEHENFPEEYLFTIDEKLLHSVEEKEGKLYFNPKKLYPDKEMDLAETISCLKGLKIKKITKDYVEFENGEKVVLKDNQVEVEKVAPALWWR